MTSETTAKPISKAEREWREGWAHFVDVHREDFRVGSEAKSHGGYDLSRPAESSWRGRVIEVSSVIRDGDDSPLVYIGHWLAGLGFIDVSFPASTTTALDDGQAAWLREHPVTFR